MPLAPDDLARCLQALHPDGAAWVSASDLVDGCRAWGEEHGQEELASLTTVGFGRLVGGGVPGVEAKKTARGRGFRIAWPSVHPPAQAEPASVHPSPAPAPTASVHGEEPSVHPPEQAEPEQCVQVRAPDGDVIEGRTTEKDPLIYCDPSAIRKIPPDSKRYPAHPRVTLRIPGREQEPWQLVATRGANALILGGPSHQRRAAVLPADLVEGIPEPEPLPLDAAAQGLARSFRGQVVPEEAEEPLPGPAATAEASPLPTAG